MIKRAYCTDKMWHKCATNLAGTSILRAFLRAQMCFYSKYVAQIVLTTTQERLNSGLLVCYKYGEN